MKKYIPFYRDASRDSNTSEKHDQDHSSVKMDNWQIGNALVESVIKPAFTPINNTYSLISSTVHSGVNKLFSRSRKRSLTKLKVTNAEDDWVNVDKLNSNIKKSKSIQKPENTVKRDFTELEKSLEFHPTTNKHKANTEKIKFKSEFPSEYGKYPSFDDSDFAAESNARKDSKFSFFEQCLTKSQTETNFSHFKETPNPNLEPEEEGKLVLNAISACLTDIQRLQTLVTVSSLKNKKLANRIVLEVLSLFDSDCSRLVALKTLKPCISSLSGEDLLDFMDLFAGANNKYIAMECVAEGESLSDEEIGTVSCTFADEEVRKQSVIQLRRARNK